MFDSRAVSFGATTSTGMRLRSEFTVALLFASAFLLRPTTALELRCHCNLPSCVRTSYMCKSSRGCFQELPIFADSARQPAYGCLELWPAARPYQCLPELDGSDDDENAVVLRFRRLRRTHDLHRLRCCDDDMCNYVVPEGYDSGGKFEQEVDIERQPSAGSVDGSSLPSSTRSSPLFFGGGEWFKAAVIAVPLAGVFILLILVVIAFGLLRTTTETQKSARLLSAVATTEEERSKTVAAVQRANGQIEHTRLSARDFG